VLKKMALSNLGLYFDPRRVSSRSTMIHFYDIDLEGMTTNKA
jgi:hypothetical protein